MNLRPRIRFLASLVLAWYVLFLGASVASAGFGGTTFQEVCSADGVVKWVPHQDETQLHGHSGMDCPLCAGFFLPPPAAGARQFGPFGPGTPPSVPVAATHRATVSAPPLPSRGPPSLSFS